MFVSAVTSHEHVCKIAPYMFACMQFVRLSSDPASQESLKMVHCGAHIDSIRKHAEKAPCIVADFDADPNDVTYMTTTTYTDALEV